MLHNDGAKNIRNPKTEQQMQTLAAAKGDN